jgi:hypothetical protein
MMYLSAISKALYDWQTLIAGIVAFIGAWFTVRALNKQAREEAERKARAARSMLPATLSVVGDYSQSSIRWLKSIRQKAEYTEQGKYAANSAIAVGTSPRPDSGMLASLKNCVETFEIENARFVAFLLNKIQVHHARVAGLQDYFENYPSFQVKRVGLSREIDVYIANSVEIVAMTNQLFPFARMDTDAAALLPDLPAFRSAFRDCHLDEARDVQAWNKLTNQFLEKERAMIATVSL